MNWDVEMQAALAQAAIALSVFSLITYLWLGATVLLMGDRRSLVTWAGALGLLSGALFFLSHGALVGAGVTEGNATDFWWHVSWLPAFAAPLFWAAIGLHYAGLAGAWRRLRMPALLAVGALGACAALLALLSWPFIAHYDDFIRLLDAALRPQITRQLKSVPPTVPLLGLAFVVYIAACACLPWASLVVRRLLIEPRERASHSSEGAGVEGAGTSGMGGESALLWDARDAWSRARPALLAASLCIMGAGAVVAVIGVLLAISQHRSALLPFADHLPQPLPVPETQPGHAPLLLVVADLCVQGALVGVGLMVGWAVVRQGVLVERRLPQRGFTSYWRGMAALAALFACVVAWMAALDAGALPDLLLLVALVALTSALLTWQSYVAHDRLLVQLRPFVASLSVGHTGWLATDPQEVERSVMALFTSLCRDVLGAGHGRLTVTAGRFSRAFAWQSPLREAVEPGDAREWTLPVSDERGVVARLTLGPRVDGAGYTSADLEIARACGQRILDAVGEFVAAQAVAQLARRRGLEAELSAALPRRALHDEILPGLHLAMLQLESLRARLRLSQGAVPAKTPVAVLSGAADELVTAPAPTDGAAGSVDAELGAVVGELGKTHHDLARLMRSAPMASPRRMEHGFTGALRGSLDGEFRGVFDRLVWDAAPEASAAADALPAIVADLLLSATLEAVRNAGRHARGDDLRRKLTLWVTLAATPREVTVKVADDGVGLRPVAPEASASAQSSAPPEVTSESPERVTGSKTESKTESSADTETNPGTRSGLLTHAALVALIGGALTAHSDPGNGATVTIRVPRAGSE